MRAWCALFASFRGRRRDLATNVLRFPGRSCLMKAKAWHKSSIRLVFVGDGYDPLAAGDNDCPHRVENSFSFWRKSSLSRVGTPNFAPEKKTERMHVWLGTSTSTFHAFYLERFFFTPLFRSFPPASTAAATLDLDPDCSAAWEPPAKASKPDRPPS